MRDADHIRVPGLGYTQRELLHALKRRGPSTTAQLAEGTDLAMGTLREHIRSLEARRLVERVGRRREGPGRPHVIYSLTDAGEALFPQGEAEVLVEMVEYLLGTGRVELVEEFFLNRAKAGYDEVAGRIEQLASGQRLQETKNILAEAGFMPELGEDEETGEPVICLCHCPLKSVVAVTQLPCNSENRLITALVGEALERFTYMPDGDENCSYRIKAT
jgi:predicted ArsR family transcriptional regulator